MLAASAQSEADDFALLSSGFAKKGGCFVPLLFLIERLFQSAVRPLRNERVAPPSTAQISRRSTMILNRFRGSFVPRILARAAQPERSNMPMWSCFLPLS
jgi:hypothetical protein